MSSSSKLNVLVTRNDFAAEMLEPLLKDKRFNVTVSPSTVKWHKNTINETNNMIFSPVFNEI